MLVKNRALLKAVITFDAELTVVSMGVGLTAVADSCVWVATVCVVIAPAGLITVGKVEEARSALVTLQANHIVFAITLTISIVANG